MTHKNNFGGENYFSIVNNVDHTRKSAQLCISAHHLYILKMEDIQDFPQI